MPAAVAAAPSSSSSDDVEYRILALYRFVPLIPLPSTFECGHDDYQQPQPQQGEAPPLQVERHPTLLALQSELSSTLRAYNVRGTLLLAPEGINGTICYPVRRTSTHVTTATAAVHQSGDDGSNVSIHDNDTEYDDPVVKYLKNHPLFGGPDLRTRLSVWKDEYENGEDTPGNNEQHQLLQSPQQAFQRLKIKIKAEIVTLGLGRATTKVDNYPIASSAADVSDSASDATTAAVPTSSPPTSSTLNHHHQQQQQQQRYQSNHLLSNPLTIKGQYLNPSQWDQIAIHNPNILVIDTRNTYEIDIGTFESAINPHTQNFSDLPVYLTRLAEEYDWSSYSNKDGSNDEDEVDVYGRGGSEKDVGEKVVDASAADEDQLIAPANNKYPKSLSSSSAAAAATTKKKKPPPEGIAMFCTGGIRCEKATSYAIQSKLFPKDMPIYHLEGGILAYLDHVAERRSSEGGGVGGSGEEEDAGKTRERKTEVETEKEEEDERGVNADNTKKNCIDKRPLSSSSLKSTFRGECFVFDKRVAVTKGLRPSRKYISCHGCRGPMDYRLLLESTSIDDDSSTTTYEAQDDEVEAARYQALAAGILDLPPLRYDARTQRHYLPGLTCPRCHASTTRESLERFAERNRQVEFCKREGKVHFQDQGGGGSEVVADI
ncbi:hypothetical protein ACHAXH_003994 [Discostella pseudostelligera]